MTVPVVIAAGRRKIPTIIHESDMTPGLANKICIPSATKVCCNFPVDCKKVFLLTKQYLTGTPIRQELLNGSKEAAREFCGFTDDKPVLMVIGGSLGAASVNENIRKILPELLKEFQVSTCVVREKWMKVSKTQKDMYSMNILNRSLPICLLCLISLSPAQVPMQSVN